VYKSLGQLRKSTEFRIAYSTKHKILRDYQRTIAIMNHMSGSTMEMGTCKMEVSAIHQPHHHPPSVVLTPFRCYGTGTSSTPAFSRPPGTSPTTPCSLPPASPPPSSLFSSNSSAVLATNTTPIYSANSSGNFVTNNSYFLRPHRRIAATLQTPSAACSTRRSELPRCNNLLER
jgi:hypothetical protein